MRRITIPPLPWTGRRQKKEVTITTGAAVADATRTEYENVDGAHTIKWVVGDQVGIYSLDVQTPAQSAGYNEIFTVESVDNDGVAVLEGELTDYFLGAARQTENYAYYPYQAAAGNTPSAVTWTLPEMQQPTVASFDGRADLLLGVPILTTAPVGQMSDGEGGYTDLNFGFIRPLAISSFGVNNIPAEAVGETVSEVVLIFEDGLSVAGDLTLDLTAPSYTMAAGGTNRITLGVEGSPALDADFKAWWIMNPVTSTELTISIETENYIITRTIDSTIEFMSGQNLNIATVNLSSATVTPKGSDDSVVITIDTINDGGAGITTSYADDYRWTQDGYDFYGTRIMRGIDNSEVIQGQANNMIIYNLSGMNEIQSVVVNTTAATDFTLYGATTPRGTDDAVTPTVSGTVYTFDLSGGTYPYFTIHKNAAGAIYINSITVDYLPGSSALAPPALTASDITANSFVVSWDAVNNATGYEVSINGTTFDTATGTSHEFTGLTAETSYTAYVRAVGDGSDYTTSPAATVQVTTGMEGDTRIFRKVTTSLADYTGTYLIVCESVNMALSVSAGNYYNGVSVADDIDASEGTIDFNSILEGYTVDIEASGSGYSIYSNGQSAYLAYTAGATSTNNYLYSVMSVTSDTGRWTISISAGDAIITNMDVTTRNIRWNAGSPRFSTYTSAQTPIQLYVLADE